jgi:cbb3-type cytochrome oxidase maturation protein
VDSLYVLIPLSLVLVLAIGGILAWAVLSGQFDALEGEGRRIVEDDASTRQASRDDKERERVG